MNLPPIKTAADVDKAAEKVTQALRRGAITPTEAAILMTTLESRPRIMGRVPPEEHTTTDQKELTDPGLTRLTDDELDQLIALTEKLEGAGSGADRTGCTPTAEA